MGRILRQIRVKGRRFWALFDSGADNSYVVPAAGKRIPRQKLKPPWKSRLGGSEHQIAEGGFLVATIEARHIDGDVYVIDEIGTGKKGRPIDVLIGAFMMRKWGITLDLKNERLDFTHYPKEFLEFGS